MGITKHLKLGSGKGEVVKLGVAGILAGIVISSVMKRVGNSNYGRKSLFGYWGQGKDSEASQLPDPLFGAAQSGGFYGQWLRNKNDDYLANSTPYKPLSSPPPISRFAFSNNGEEKCGFIRTTWF